MSDNVPPSSSSSDGDDDIHSIESENNHTSPHIVNDQQQPQRLLDPEDLPASLPIQLQTMDGFVLLAAIARVTEIAQEILQLSSAFPEDVRDHYVNTCNRVSSVVILMMNNPPNVPRAQELVNAMESMLAMARQNANWPKEPLPIPDHVIHVPSIYYAHSLYGVLYLSFTNPLPMPSERLMCDLCENDITMGFQCVDQGGERDKTRFADGLLGFDLCVHCATSYFRRQMQKLFSWVTSISSSNNTCSSDDDGAALFWPQGAVKGHDIRVVDRCIDGATGMTRTRLAISPPTNTTVVIFCDDLMELLQSTANKMKHDTSKEPAPSELGLALKEYVASGVVAGRGGVIVSEEKQQMGGLDPVEEMEDCCICTDPLKAVDHGRLYAVKTPCGHHFHEGCLQKVRRADPTTHKCDSEGKTNMRCPLCRQLFDVDLIASLQPERVLVIVHDAAKVRQQHGVVVMSMADVDCPETSLTVSMKL
eukprot:PhM_4_TR8336/c0_g1_i1/m.73241